MAKEPQINLKEAIASGVTNDELKKLLEENLRLMQEVHEMTHKIKSYVSFQKFMSFVYVVLILGPVIFSIIYLPPLLKQVMGQYTELLGPANPGTLLNSVNSALENKQQ